MKIGLDLLATDPAVQRLLRGVRFGLLAHPASVTRDYVHVADVLHGLGLRPEVVFGPEHGYGGEAQDMIGVGDSRDQYGVPVYNAAANFTVVRGGGRVDSQLPRTDVAGITFANITLGPQLGEQQFALNIANLSPLSFFGRARRQPAIDTDGVVNAATGLPGRVAPGS
mgnify:CR=1 FL=1